MQKILILCTGNSCRSQMAEGILKSINNQLQVYSAGTKPAAEVHPKAVEVMAEIDIDLSQNYPKLVDQFLTMPFDYVITVCDSARESCPVFSGKVINKLHIGFDDPAEATGNKKEILAVFRRVRDEIQHDFKKFYHHYIYGREN